MAKWRKAPSPRLATVAEAAGRAAGRIAGTFDSLQAQYPHLLDEAQAAMAAGKRSLARLRSKAGAQATTMAKKAKAVTKKATKKAVGKVGQTIAARRPRR